MVQSSGQVVTLEETQAGTTKKVPLVIQVSVWVSILDVVGYFLVSYDHWFNTLTPMSKNGYCVTRA